VIAVAAAPEDLKVQGRWQAQARSNLREQIYRLRRQLALNFLKSRSKRDPRKVADVIRQPQTARGCAN